MKPSWVSHPYVEGSDLLKVSDASAVQVASSDGVMVGESAIAIGNAQGYGISVSLGVVSVDSEYITMTAADGKTSVKSRLMRVDTAVNPGNSGGGLFNGKGELIGIVNAKIVDEEVDSIGYAIPSAVAVAVADNIIDHCLGTDAECVQRAMLGITVAPIDSKAVYDPIDGSVRIVETVSVYELSEDSIANGILQSGDVMVSASFNESTVVITRQYHIIDMMLRVRAGDEIELSIIRGDEEMTVKVTVTEECLTEY